MHVHLKPLLLILGAAELGGNLIAQHLLGCDWHRAGSAPQPAVLNSFLFWIIEGLDVPAPLGGSGRAGRVSGAGLGEDRHRCCPERPAESWEPLRPDALPPIAEIAYAYRLHGLYLTYCCLSGQLVISLYFVLWFTLLQRGCKIFQLFT